MLNIIPVVSLLFNLFFIFMLETTLSFLIPKQWLPFNDYIRTSILYLIILFVMYTEFGQICVAFVTRGRNTIGREEKKLQPVMEHLKDKTDIKGYSAPVLLQYQILNALNNLTGKKIKKLDRKVNKMKYEYLTGTVKIFTFDSLDIETNSYGNSIFISKGAIDTLTDGELRAVIYNEFAQIKTNISNMRLLHDGTILLGRISAVATIIIAPVALVFGVISGSVSEVVNNGAFGTSFLKIFSNMAILIMFVIICIARLVIATKTKKYTNALYMFYERKIFIRADRATHKSGFSADMVSYLEKLYAFKLGDKDYSKLFIELRPLVAYRINYYDNVLGKNINLSADNYGWSSNYMERVQTVNNNKSM